VYECTGRPGHLLTGSRPPCRRLDWPPCTPKTPSRLRHRGALRLVARRLLRACLIPGRLSHRRGL